MMNARNILILAPHTDDAELGCGGSMVRLREEGVKIFVAVFSTAEESLPAGVPNGTLKDEFFNAMEIMGIPEEQRFVYDYPVRRLSYFRQEVLEELVKLRKQVEPDMVFIPSGQDLHQDHKVVFNEGLRAFKDLTLLGYELPWNHITFSAQAFISLKKNHLDKKWEALQAYKTQLQLERPYFSSDFLNGLAKLRGTQVKSEWAEAFEVIRIRF